MRFIVLFFIIFTFNMATAQEKPTLFYIGDPMCSWCYGFAPELKKALTDLGGEVHLQLIMGGLRPYNTETMQDLSGFLKGHWEQVNQASGQPFSYEVLTTDWVYDTEPASRAVLVVRRLKPSVELAFFKAIQIAFYQKNKNPNLMETYAELATEFGIDQTEFKSLFASEELKSAVRKDFERAGAMGVSGFPSMILQKGEEYFLISNGYKKGEQISATVRQFLD